MSWSFLIAGGRRNHKTCSQLVVSARQRQAWSGSRKPRVHQRPSAALLCGRHSSLAHAHGTPTHPLVQKSGVARLTHTTILSSAASVVVVAAPTRQPASLARHHPLLLSGPGAMSAARDPAPSIHRWGARQLAPTRSRTRTPPYTAHPPRRPAGSRRAALLLRGLVRAPDLELRTAAGTRHGTRW